MEGEQPGWSALTGQTYAEYQGYGWSQAIHPDDAQDTIKAWREAVQETKTFVFEHRLRRSDGSWGQYAIRAVPVMQPDGTIREWVGVHTDITDQRKAEANVRESEKQLRLLSEVMPQIVWSTGPDGYHDYFNKQWYEFTGLSYEATKGEGWAQVLHPDDLQRTEAKWHHSLQTGEDYEVEYRMRRADGVYRWLLARATPFHNDRQEIIRWFGTCTDIHDQKTMAVQLEELVQKRTYELQRSNEDLQQFAHVASHDLKEPVRKIRTFGSRLNDEYGAQLPFNARVYLGKIESAADRMYAMIDGVLTYSSLNVLEQGYEKISLSRLVQEVQADLEVLIQEREATLVYANLPLVTGAPVLLHQLFYNLINNSLKFVRPGVSPRIQITAEQLPGLAEAGEKAGEERSFVKLTVQDNGIGFGPEDATRIFQTFSRLHPKDKYEGTGLGLALCKKIAERHGGSIRAEGKKGEGAIFTLLLPA